MDVIAAHQFGHANVVAQMGTALTERQVALIKRHTRNVVLALDADAAGTEATLRGIEVATGDSNRPPSGGVVALQEQGGVEIRILSIPEGKDPDDLIRKDAELWKQLVEGARPVVDHLIDQLPRRYDVNDPREAGKAAREVLPALQRLQDPVVRDHYLQRLARVVHVDESSLRELLSAPRAVDLRSKQPQLTVVPAGRGPEPVEEYLLALLVAFPHLRAIEIPQPNAIFTVASHLAIYEAIQGLGDAEAVPEVDEDLAPDLMRIQRRDIPPLTDEDAVAALEETVWRLEQRNLKRAKQVVADALAEAEASNPERSHLPDLLAMLRQAENGLTDEEVDQLARLYLDDYQKGLELHRRLLDRYPDRDVLTDARKRGIQATVVHQMNEEMTEEEALRTT